VFYDIEKYFKNIKMRERERKEEILIGRKERKKKANKN